MDSSLLCPHCGTPLYEHSGIKATVCHAFNELKKEANKKQYDS